MSRLATLKAAASLGDVARLLQFKPAALAFILYKQPAATKYKTFDIPKRSGGTRTIRAPVDPLKLLQRRLSDLLQDCLDELHSARQRPDRAAHGFKRHRSIITNAGRHRHRRWVFNLDLDEFFPTINFGRVRGYFLKNRDFELATSVATIVAQIACHENSLPQGSPCSPVISNLVAHLLDLRMISVASQAGCTYSRYADDLTFSTNKRNFPGQIAVPAVIGDARPRLWLPGEVLRSQIEIAGYRINPHKSHLMFRESRQTVTGLIVNETVNVRQEYRRNARAMVHRLVTTGHFEAVGVTHENGQAVLHIRDGRRQELHGMLGFIDSVQHVRPRPTRASVGPRRSSTENVYRQFLFYDTFYAARLPVIICEGDTDNVYLTHAIRSLAAEFPILADVGPDKKIRLRVRLYKYPQSSTARLLELEAGGYTALSKFIAAYRNEMKLFGGPGLAEPVLILYDSDDGAKSIRSTIKSVFKIDVSGFEPYVRAAKNLYALPTPLEAGAESSTIEDFFDKTIKSTVVEGKLFNPGKDFDENKHYSKRVFAHKVVRPRADRIDFSGFRPLLANIATAITEHHRQASETAAPDPDEPLPGP